MPLCDRVLTLSLWPRGTTERGGRHSTARNGRAALAVSSAFLVSHKLVRQRKCQFPLAMLQFPRRSPVHVYQTHRHADLDASQKCVSRTPLPLSTSRNASRARGGAARKPPASRRTCAHMPAPSKIQSLGCRPVAKVTASMASQSAYALPHHPHAHTQLAGVSSVLADPHYQTALPHSRRSRDFSTDIATVRRQEICLKPHRERPLSGSSGTTSTTTAMYVLPMFVEKWPQPPHSHSLAARSPSRSGVKGENEEK